MRVFSAVSRTFHVVAQLIAHLSVRVFSAVTADIDLSTICRMVRPGEDCGDVLLLTGPERALAERLRLVIRSEKPADLLGFDNSARAETPRSRP